MSTNIDTELRKVTAVTTLYHLCPVSLLEKLAVEAKDLFQKNNTCRNCLSIKTEKGKRGRKREISIKKLEN